jgi:hypothetical protein
LELGTVPRFGRSQNVIKLRRQTGDYLCLENTIPHELKPGETFFADVSHGGLADGRP